MNTYVGWTRWWWRRWRRRKRESWGTEIWKGQHNTGCVWISRPDRTSELGLRWTLGWCFELSEMYVHWHDCETRCMLSGRSGQFGYGNLSPNQFITALVLLCSQRAQKVWKWKHHFSILMFIWSAVLPYGLKTIGFNGNITVILLIDIIEYFFHCYSWRRLL